MSTSPDLQTLLDEREILQVVTRYARALDTKEWALLDDVFVPDATGDLASPTPLVGVDAIRTRIRAALEHLDASQHLVGNHEIQVDGDDATHRCYLQAQHVRQAAARRPQLHRRRSLRGSVPPNRPGLADRPPSARGDVDRGQRRGGLRRRRLNRPGVRIRMPIR